LASCLWDVWRLLKPGDAPQKVDQRLTEKFDTNRRFLYDSPISAATTKLSSHTIFAAGSLSTRVHFEPIQELLVIRPHSSWPWLKIHVLVTIPKTRSSRDSKTGEYMRSGTHQICSWRLYLGGGGRSSTVTASLRSSGSAPSTRIDFLGVQYCFSCLEATTSTKRGLRTSTLVISPYATAVTSTATELATVAVSRMVRLFAGMVSTAKQTEKKMLFVSAKGGHDVKLV